MVISYIEPIGLCVPNLPYGCNNFWIIFCKLIVIEGISSSPAKVARPVDTAQSCSDVDNLGSPINHYFRTPFVTSSGMESSCCT